MIAKCAYRKSEKRDFADGYELQNWLEAEESGSRYFCESFYGHPCPTNKDRLCERSEPQSYPVVGRARQ